MHMSTWYTVLINENDDDDDDDDENHTGESIPRCPFPGNRMVRSQISGNEKIMPRSGFPNYY